MITTTYEGINKLGADICTGGPGFRAWVSGMHMHRKFSDWELEQALTIDVHATVGCEILDWPIDAPEYLPAGSARMDWFPRTNICMREGS